MATSDRPRPRPNEIACHSTPRTASRERPAGALGPVRCITGSAQYPDGGPTGGRGVAGRIRRDQDQPVAAGRQPLAAEAPVEAHAHGAGGEAPRDHAAKNDIAHAGTPGPVPRVWRTQPPPTRRPVLARSSPRRTVAASESVKRTLVPARRPARRRVRKLRGWAETRRQHRRRAVAGDGGGGTEPAARRVGVGVGVGACASANALCQ